MRPRILVHGALAFAAATCLLMLFWLLLPSAGQASPMSEVPTSVSLLKPSPPPTPDPRWLALIRAPQPHHLAAQQIAPPSINVHLTDGFVAGRVAIAATVAVSVTRGGSQVAHVMVAPVPIDDGFFYLAYPDWSGNSYAAGGGGGYYGGFQAGDVVWVSQTGVVVSMTLPALSALAATDSDTVYGTAPISEPVTVYVFPFATPEVSYTRTITSDGAGNYQADFAPTDLRPHDSGYVAYAEATDRRAYIRFVAPLLRVRVNGWEMSGFAAPRSTVLITVTDAQGTPWYWLTANTGTEGSFWIPSFDRTRLLRPGDHVTATAGGQSFSMTVLTVTAHADLTSGQVWGEAPPAQSVEVMRFVGPLQSGYDSIQLDLPADQTTTTATLTGHYTASLPLAPADYGAAVVTGPDGHQTYTRFNIPYLWIHMGEDDATWPYGYYAIWGQVDDFAAPITIAIQGPSGYLKDLRHLTAAGNGYFYDGPYRDYLALDSGDVITITTPRSVQVALTLPQLTAQADPISDTVFGLAPPGARLTISVYGWPPQPLPVPTPTPTPPHTDLGTGGGPGPSPFTLIVTATAQGKYVADFSGLVDITSQSNGQVQMTTPEGYTVARTFRIIQRCQQPYLESAQVGGNSLNIQGNYGCPAASFYLRNAQGYLKVTRSLDFAYTANWWLALYEGSRPIPIVPGDTIEIVSGTDHVTTTIPTLTVLLDPTTNTISGQSPSDVVIELRRLDFTAQWFTPTGSAEGTYSVTLSAQDALRAGDHARVTCTSAGQPRFYADDILPFLKTTLYQSSLQGSLPPITPYTVSLETSRPITAQVSGYAGMAGEFYTSLPPLLPDDTVVVTTPRQVSRLTLPSLSANVDRTAATVYGQAPPNSRLQVDLFYSTVEYKLPYRSLVVTATATGVYTASFPDVAPLPGMSGELTYFSDTGHRVILRFTTERYWAITLDTPCVGGDVGTSYVPITVTLEARNSITLETRTSQTGLTSYFNVCFSAPVRPDDRLTLIHPTGIMTFTVPHLTAEHNYARQTLVGQAVPESAILAVLPINYWDSVSRHTQADATGRYGLDTSDPNVPLMRSGYVVMTDEAGNTVQRNFTIQGYRTFLPVVAYSRQN